jgi:hypothetical protein
LQDFGFSFILRHKDSSLVYNNNNGFTPVSGTIEHSGTVTFHTDSLGAVTVGDFSIGYDATRKGNNTSGFFVRDTAGLGAILFDVGNPDSVSAKRRNLDIGNADLLVSPEFNSFLNQQGLTHQNLTGADVGDVAIDAKARPIGVGNNHTSSGFESSSIFDVAVPSYSGSIF